ncbi:MAG: hypothetical protein PHI66_05330 [Candidatus Pacebacteria bacterium]|nr:hypothetical protein [Candidatus Paceibacterota bacterium]
MNQNIKDKIKNTLPEFVFDNLYEDYTFDANGKIIDGYLRGENKGLESKRIDNMKDVLGLITLKEIRMDNLVSEIESRLGLDEKAAREVALIMLSEIFYPIKDFFPGIDDEILKLGGELPKIKPKTISDQLLKRESEIEDMRRREEQVEQERMADAIVTEGIESLITKFPEAGMQTIGSQDSIEVKSMPVKMKPMIKYWIADYKEKMGYYQHSNLERVQYVCHDKNTRNMNEEERRQLNLVLKSWDGELALPYSTKRKKIDFALVNED